MPRTHHGANAYRLSCGCVTALTGVTRGTWEQDLLCALCCQSSVIAFRYPSGRVSCAVTCVAGKPGGGVTRARCCLLAGHDGNTHFDASVELWYALPGRLAAGRKGKTLP